jgi:hypothetical protein
MKFDEISMKSSAHLAIVLTDRDAAPDTGISNKTMAILNSFVNDIFERICKLKRIGVSRVTGSLIMEKLQRAQLRVRRKV